MVLANMPYKEELTVIRVVDSSKDRSVPQFYKLIFTATKLIN